MLKRFPDITYARYPATDYLPADILDRAEAMNPQGVLRGLRVSLGRLTESLRIYVIRRGPSGVCPSNLAAYAIPFGDCFLFLRDEPGQIGGVRKFYIFHEVGHALMMAAMPKLRVTFGTWTLWFAAFWLAWSVRWTPLSALIAVSLVLTILSLGHEWRRRQETLRLEDEVAADLFGLEALEPEERDRVAAFFARYPFPRDVTLSEPHHAARLDRFNANLEALRQGRAEAVDTASELHAPLSIVTSVVLIVALADFARSPSAPLIAIAAAVAVLVLLLVLLITFLNVMLDLAIDQHLAEHDASRDDRPGTGTLATPEDRPCRVDGEGDRVAIAATDHAAR